MNWLNSVKSTCWAPVASATGSAIVDTIRDIKSTKEKATSFLKGAAYTPILFASNVALIKLACSVSFISQESLESSAKRMLEKATTGEFECPPMSWNIPMMIMGMPALAMMLGLGPSAEEFLYREILQKYFLRDKLLSKLESCSLKTQEIWKSTCGNLIRAAAIGALFALYHEVDPMLTPSENRDLFYQNFIFRMTMSLSTCLLSEKINFFAAAGIHTTNNAALIVSAFPLMMEKCFKWNWI